MVSVTDPYGHILGFLGRLLFYNLANIKLICLHGALQNSEGLLLCILTLALLLTTEMLPFEYYRVSFLPIHILNGRYSQLYMCVLVAATWPSN
jgi:hypothetical protein